MLYHFDEFGWFSPSAIEGRSTDVPLPSEPLQEGYGWNFTGYIWFQQKLIPDVIVIPQIPLSEQDRKITKLAFLNRFTDEEAIKLDLASIGATVQAAAIRRYLQKVNAATFIDLARDDLVSGVTHLESLNILTTGRADAILNTPVSEQEKYRGV